MSNAIRCHDLVHQPYARVRDALLAGPLHVFRRATAAAATGSARLGVPLGPIDVATDVSIDVLDVTKDGAFGDATTVLTLAWSARSKPHLFPQMTATLALTATSPTETQLELDGHYTVPFGRVGERVTHPFVEASVQRFLVEVAAWLDEELAYKAGMGAAV